MPVCGFIGHVVAEINQVAGVKAGFAHLGRAAIKIVSTILQ